jgi:glycosyltransferase involved in cell wall biosynthesis
MISVVIPTYNEAAFIGRLLESLASQEHEESLEVIISDNESTDQTREVAGRFLHSFSNLLIVEGGTPAVGRNRGAKASTGNPIFFIDADLELRDPMFLNRNVSYFRSRDLAAASVRLSPISRNPVDHILVGAYNALLVPAVYVRPLGSMCIAADRTIFERSGGYPEDVVMAEDHDFVLRCSKVGRYGIMPLCACFDVRRLDKEGRLPLVLKYLRASALRVFSGPITEFDYDFGCFSRDCSDVQDCENVEELSGQ